MRRVEPGPLDGYRGLVRDRLGYIEIKGAVVVTRSHVIDEQGADRSALRHKRNYKDRLVREEGDDHLFGALVSLSIGHDDGASCSQRLVGEALVVQCERVALEAAVKPASHTIKGGRRQHLPVRFEEPD